MSKREEKRMRHGVFFLGRKIGKLEVFAVENHRLCFDIARNLSVVLGFFSTKLGIMLLFGLML